MLGFKQGNVPHIDAFVVAHQTARRSRPLISQEVLGFADLAVTGPLQRNPVGAVLKLSASTERSKHEGKEGK